MLSTDGTKWSIVAHRVTCTAVATRAKSGCSSPTKQHRHQKQSEKTASLTRSMPPFNTSLQCVKISSFSNSNPDPSSAGHHSISSLFQTFFPALFSLEFWSPLFFLAFCFMGASLCFSLTYVARRLWRVVKVWSTDFLDSVFVFNHLPNCVFYSLRLNSMSFLTRWRAPLNLSQHFRMRKGLQHFVALRQWRLCAILCCQFWENLSGTISHWIRHVAAFLRPFPRPQLSYSRWKSNINQTRFQRTLDVSHISELIMFCLQYIKI